MTCYQSVVLCFGRRKEAKEKNKEKLDFTDGLQIINSTAKA